MEISRPLQQHPRFAAALQDLGSPVAAASLPGGGALYMVQRFGLRFATRGPVWETLPPPDERRRALRVSGVHLLNAEQADTTIRQAGFRQTHTGAWVAELRLDDSTPERLHPKWRATWRKATTCTLHIAPWSAKHHGWLLDTDLAQQRKAGYRALPHALIPAFAATAPDAVMVHTAYLHDTPVAAMLFLLHPPVVTYHLGWTSDAGRKAGAHHQILMNAAKGFAAQGFHRLDLGSVDTQNSPGLARFKIGTGANIRQLGGTWIRLPGL